MTRSSAYFLGLLLAVSLAAGCSSNMFAKGAGGAMAGAASGAFLGAVTDLIVDGQVNTDRLERNLVSGALAGGAAGAAVGHQQDQRAAQAQAAAQASKPADAGQDMIKKIGRSNYDALVALINYQHEDAYRLAVKGGKSKDQEQQEASFVVRALVDKDRGNADGMEDAIGGFLASDQGVSEAEARKGLNDLYQRLEDERKARGVWKKQ